MCAISPVIYMCKLHSYSEYAFAISYLSLKMSTHIQHHLVLGKTLESKTLLQ